MPKNNTERATRKIRLYGLTGGIGSGKSEAGRCFARRGVPVLEADRIGHEVLMPGGDAESAVIAAFGQEIAPCGTIDRGRLADVVFSNPEQLKRLNEITHPVIFQEILRQAKVLEEAGHRFALVEAALWGESGVLAEWMDGLVLVLASEPVRMQRLVELRGLPPEVARARMAAQTPPERKISLADWIIENEGNLDALQARVEACVEAMHGRG